MKKQKLNWSNYVGCCKGIDAEKIIAEIHKERHDRDEKLRKIANP